MYKWDVRFDGVEERSTCVSDYSTLVCEKIDYVPELGEKVEGYL